MLNESLFGSLFFCLKLVGSKDESKSLFINRSREKVETGGWKGVNASKKKKKENSSTNLMGSPHNISSSLFIHKSDCLHPPCDCFLLVSSFQPALFGMSMRKEERKKIEDTGTRGKAKCQLQDIKFVICLLHILVNASLCCCMRRCCSRSFNVNHLVSFGLCNKCEEEKKTLHFNHHLIDK